MICFQPTNSRPKSAAPVLNLAATLHDLPSHNWRSNAAGAFRTAGAPPTVSIDCLAPDVSPPPGELSGPTVTRLRARSFQRDTGRLVKFVKPPTKKTEIKPEDNDRLCRQIGKYQEFRTPRKV